MDVRGLFEEEHDELYQYLVRFTGDADLAADAIQEAYLAAIERPPKRRENLRGWLYTVATNGARQAMRRDTRQRRLLEANQAAVPLGQEAPPPDRHAIDDEERALVRAALTDLSEKERMIVLLWDQGLKQREIAAAVGISTASIGTVLARSLQKLTARCNALRGS